MVGYHLPEKFMYGSNYNKRVSIEITSIESLIEMAESLSGKYRMRNAYSEYLSSFVKYFTLQNRSCRFLEAEVVAKKPLILLVEL